MLFWFVWIPEKSVDSASTSSEQLPIESTLLSIMFKLLNKLQLLLELWLNIVLLALLLLLQLEQLLLANIKWFSFKSLVGAMSIRLVFALFDLLHFWLLPRSPNRKLDDANEFGMESLRAVDTQYGIQLKSRDLGFNFFIGFLKLFELDKRLRVTIVVLLRQFCF